VSAQIPRAPRANDIITGSGLTMEYDLSQGERRLAAIMFTDMVGYTALGQRNESLSLALVEEQRKVVRPVLARHNGREVKTMGDAFLVEFPNAVDAVRCAYDIQRAVREFDLSMDPEKRIHLRIGLHVGEVVGSQGDISGDAVNVASRVEPLSEEGGVSLTSGVYDLVRGRVDLPLVSIGPKSLKNVSAPVEVFRMVMPWEKERRDAVPKLDALRVAVLPFTNMSPDPDDEYFADGMTEELIDRLAHVKGIEVIARTSVMVYKGEKKKASQMASELGVGSLVEGSVRKAGNRVRVTAQLINGATEGHLWSEHFDGSLDDIFAVQSEIAEKVVGGLKVRLLDSEKQTLEKRPTQSTEAYTEFLQGLQLVDRMEEAPLRSALALFEGAVSKDPSFARAYASIARSYLYLANYGYMDREEALEKGRSAAMKGLEIDPELADLHSAIAMMLFSADDDVEGSRRETRKALELNPNLAEAYLTLSEISAALGDLPEMVRATEMAYKLDPATPRRGVTLGTVYFYAGRYEDALNQWEKSLHFDPYRAYRAMFDYYANKGDYAQAEKMVKELERLGPGMQFTYLNRGYLAALTGDTRTAHAMIEKLDALHMSSNASGYIYLALGDLDQFFRRLEKDADAHALSAAALRYNPLFERARKDPRMGEVFRRVGLKWA
jgi:adenylate cyclase